MSIQVRSGGLDDARVIALLEEHMADMYATSPPESVHTLDLDALAAPDVRFVTAWESARPTDGIQVESSTCGRHVDHAQTDCPGRDAGADTVLGCGAMKLCTIDGETCGELKSMRTTPAARGRGVAGQILDELMNIARAEGVSRLYLETGPQEFFAPARALYVKHGFVECGPFGDYALDPYSFFMTRAL